MKLTKHETIIYTSKILVGILSTVIACTFFSILARSEAGVCFATGFVFIMGILFLTITFFALIIPKDVYDWHTTGDILAHCGLCSYITLWNIIKSGDYISFVNIKYDGTSDEPVTMDTMFWGVVHKGTSYIQLTTNNGNKINLLPYEFSQKVASMMNSYNTILMNGKKIYSKQENIMPKVKWITY